MYGNMEVQVAGPRHPDAPAEGAFAAPEAADLRPLFHIHAELCKALANEHRLAILYTLSQGELCVGDLADKLDIPGHKVSQHLRILKERTLVQARKDGQAVYYSITNPKFIEGCTLIRQALVEQHQARGRSLLAGDVLDALQRLSVAGTR